MRALAAVAGGLPIGIIPVGTGNVLAREIGLKARAGAIAEALLEGPALDLEGATANGEPFFLMAGAGFDGEVIRRLDLPLKRKLGRAAYVPAVLGALRAPHQMMTVTVDGIPHDARWVIVAKARRYGGSFLLTDKAGIRKRGLAAVLFRGQKPWTMARQMLSLGLGRLDRCRDVSVIPGHRVEIRAPAPIPTQLDGDPFSETPLSIADGGPRLTLIVPKAFAES